MKNRFFITGLAIALAVTLFCGVFAVMGWGDLLHQVGGTVLYPFQWLFSKAENAVEGFASYFADIDELQAEIDALRAENEQLRAELVDAQIIQNESDWLYAYLSMKEDHTDYAMCAATVIASTAAAPSGGSYITHLTLNKGSAHGIAVGMPVVTRAGLVGMVIEVGIDHCRVRTVLDTSSSVGAMTVRTGELGLLEGDFNCLYDGCSLMKYMGEEADIAEGDAVVTGGQGSVYPYGIPLGRVRSVSVNAFSRTTEAVVEPYCDMTDLDQVIILTSYLRYAGEVSP